MSGISGASRIAEPAPAKVNLCLFLGAPREDGRHELVTLIESVGLCDELSIELASGPRDEVVCPAVEGPNLVTDALAGLRSAGWDAPPVRVSITKRIPVAAGLGGGSADAAALLRAAPRLGQIASEAVGSLAARLGADVPSQLHPRPAIGTGAGEQLAPVGELAAHAVLILPQPVPLSTAAVYAEADRLGLGRPADDLRRRREELEAELAGVRVRPLPGALVVNDLEPASISLCPAIEEALRAAGEGGADTALVCGSGPTVIGLFWGDHGIERARAGARALRGRFPAVWAVMPSSLPSGTIGGLP